MRYNFVTDSFNTKKLCSRLSSSELAKCDFTQVEAETSHAQDKSLASDRDAHPLLSVDVDSRTTDDSCAWQPYTHQSQLVA